MEGELKPVVDSVVCLCEHGRASLRGMLECVLLEHCACACTLMSVVSGAAADVDLCSWAETVQILVA